MATSPPQERSASAPNAATDPLAALAAENERLRALLRETEERSRIALEQADRAVADGKRVQAELEKTIVYREQLMGVLGHDLRNPLSAVKGIAALARMNPDLPAHAESKLAQIDAAVRRMLEMIGTLLDFTQARFSARMPISPAPMDLRDVVRRVADELLIAHPRASITLDVGGDSCGRWDAARIAQVVSNLVGNALAHGDGERVHVSIAGDDDAVSLRVHNDGPAITPELMASLFEPFRRGDTAAPGLGLGLYIAEQIVRAHGGTTTVRSSAEDGTTFVVQLPREARSLDGGDLARRT